ILVGEDISRYTIKQPSRFLQTFKKNYSLYQPPKLVLMKTGYRCIASLDNVGYVTMQSVYNLHITGGDMSYEALLALLNSRFVHCFIYKTFTSYKNIFPQLNQSTIQAIPVPSDIFTAQDELQNLVDRIKHFSKEIEIAVSEQEKKLLAAQIISIDSEIDQAIYDLYGLTAEEIYLIERGVR
ncbi:MAG TPA: TaqI-like C-terminal specificity domain-containing protein, partial [Ktedonobacteraceae bacterium]|nr:TaqI-like C-terminal specificity domain-containing protein [Ktedonobacteraceae bacterium]